MRSMKSCSAPTSSPCWATLPTPLTSGLSKYRTALGINASESYNIRAAVLWKPASWLDVNFSYLRQDDHADRFLPSNW